MKGDDGFHGEVATELVINATPRSKVHTDTEASYDDVEATGFVILQVNAGDIVYVRSTDVVEGILQGANYTRQWTFSGWQIM